jgi:hypothetical protein
MLKRLKQWWWRNRKPEIRTWWVASAPCPELPPLASDPSFEMRINKHNISEFRVPVEMIALEEFRYRKRHRLSPVTTIIDIADYKVGWIFSLWPITIFKLKTSKIMDAPKYVTFIKVFNSEYQKT